MDEYDDVVNVFAVWWYNVEVEGELCVEFERSLRRSRG
jgi:hypothetical protein